MIGVNLVLCYVFIIEGIYMKNVFEAENDIIKSCSASLKQERETKKRCHVSAVFQVFNESCSTNFFF